ncbi:hypothetical protein GH810_05245 [Acetobacterium paludosum]|uniref:Uncharacterized protein n=1 Tax=Acetobacterium paludosum TaxID=52693 RepID=A0A923HUX7_9FIRM|nr:hypothetical protein [Acetobacterium paludosum]MBC3887710.1 hypothetical protein [Acetobacterium paludosum]
MVCEISLGGAASAITSSESTEKLVVPILIEHGKSYMGIVKKKVCWKVE